MKLCPKCNSKCADNAQFCSECGFSFTAAGPQDTYAQPQNFQQPGGQGYQQQGYTQPGGYQQQGYAQPGWYQQQGYAQPGGYQQQAYGGYPQNNMYGSYPSPSSLGFMPRSIPVAIILSFVTFGIYAIYWMIQLNTEINAVSGDQNATSGGMVFLFTLLTCGIYGHFWMYKMGGKCDQIKNENGNSAVLYLLLNLFCLGIVSFALMQDTLNKLG